MVTGDDEEGGIFEGGGFDKIGPEDFVVEVAHEVDGVVDDFLDGLAVLAVEHADILHEPDQIDLDQLIQSTWIILEYLHELDVIEDLKVTFKNDDDKENLI